jgi:hypothetical protein
MFGFLGLDVTPEVERQFETSTAHWDEHVAKPLALTADQQDYLRERLDPTVIERFDAAFERQVARFAP